MKTCEDKKRGWSVPVLMRYLEKFALYLTPNQFFPNGILINYHKQLVINVVLNTGNHLMAVHLWLLKTRQTQFLFSLYLCFYAPQLDAANNEPHLGHHVFRGFLRSQIYLQLQVHYWLLNCPHSRNFSLLVSKTFHLVHNKHEEHAL